MNQPGIGSEKVRAHVFISGRVQGVGYRFSAQDMALLLKVNGWVRNLRDGRVEAVFEASREKVDEMLQWCRKGPPAAQVTDIQVSYEPPEGINGFEMIRSR
ncbi:acylphosphatase [filamentous cyanobacterium CCP1]|nr:acylphosphatase [filamentous cyanobacterium CCP2]PSB68004.1 acylphosphatase [filamentous cyanobacterium CCP1]